MAHDRQSMALWPWNSALPMEVHCCWMLRHSWIAVLRWFGVNRRETTCAWFCFLRDRWHHKASNAHLLSIPSIHAYPIHATLPLMAYSNHTWHCLHDDSYRYRLISCNMGSIWHALIYNLGSFLRSINPLCFSKKSSTSSCLTWLGLISSDAAAVPLATCCCSWGST